MSKPIKWKLFGPVIGGSLLILIVGIMAVVKPRLDEAGSLTRQAGDVQSQIDALRGATTPTPQQAIRVADLFRLSRAMPDRPDIPDVLLELSQVASETGVTFKSFSPKDRSTVGIYTMIPIDLVFDGNFYDVSDFLYRLRNLVDVHSGELAADGRLFTISALSFGEGEATFPKVEATMTVEAYVFGNGTPPVTSVPATPSAPSATPGEGTTPIPAVPSGATAAPAGVTP